MSKEFNLFEQEVETVAPKKKRSQPAQPDLFESPPTPRAPKKPTPPAPPTPKASKPQTEPTRPTHQSLPFDRPEKEESGMVDMLYRLRDKAEEQKEREQKKGFVKRVIEALLFASHDPITLKKIREVVDTIHPYRPRDILSMLDELKLEYKQQNRAFQLEEVGNGYILQTDPNFGNYVNLLYKNKRLEKLSQAATEVLAVIAYRQPCTRPQIEAIRGVDCSGIMQTLLERELVECVGRLEAPGRPSLFAVTPNFFKYFGIKTLEELPQVSGLDQIKRQSSPPNTHPSSEPSPADESHPPSDP